MIGAGQIGKSLFLFAFFLSLSVFGEEDLSIETPKQTVKYGIGLRSNIHAVPPFGLSLFYDVHPGLRPQEAFGFELFRRKGEIELKLSFEYADYRGDDEGDLFLNRGDDIAESEFVDNTLRLLSTDFSIIGNTQIGSSPVYFRYGAGLGVGLVLGEVRRTDTFAPDPGNLQVRQRCVSLANPDTSCIEINVKEDSIPPVVPVLNMLVGTRVKLSEKFSFRIEGGLRTLSMFAGLGFDMTF